jgi:tetratricopeptide (TPR) repeat protein
VSIVGAAIAGLAALAGVALYQARVAERARAIAANQRDKAEAVSDFMVKDLFNTYRFAREGPKTPVVALLQGADESARERFKDKPDVRYALEYSLASMYGQMGLTDKSLELVERANDTIRQVYPEGHSERRAIQSMYYAGLVELGRGAEVLDAISKAIAESDRIEGTHSITSMYMRIALAKHGLMTGDLDAADKALGEILDGQLPDEALRTAEYGQALNLRTALYLGTDRPKQAMEYIERSKVFTDQDAFRHGHDWLAVRMQEAMMLEQLGESAKALEASAPLIPIAKRLMLDSDMNLGVFIGNHANMLSRAERFADAEPVYLEAISVFEESGDPIAWEATRICLRFRDMLDRTRQWEDLETLLRRWLAHWERMRPAGDPGRVEAERSLAELLLRQGRIDEARPIIERCVAHAKAWPQGEFLHGRGAIDVSAGMLAVRDGKKEEGRALIERGLAVFKKERSAAFPFIVRVAEEELAALDQPRPTK